MRSSLVYTSRRLGGLAAVLAASRIGSESHCGPEEPAKRPLNPRDAPVRFRKDKVFESCTLQPFATVLEPVPNANGKQGMLCGTAVRCMLGMCWLEMTRAYAFGLYVDSSALRTLARRKYEWTPSGEGATAKPQPTRFLIDSKARQPRSWGELSLSLRMAIDIDGPHLAHGFKRSVAKQLMAAQAQATAAKAGDAAAQAAMDAKLLKAMDLDSSKDLPEVEDLARVFEAIGNMSKGTLVTFTWRQDGTLCMAVDGVARKDFVLRRTAVIRALFDVYCGEQPVSVEGAEAFRAALVRMTDAIMAGDSVTDAAAGSRA
ncbi:hypothetical protein FNF27_05795 [Cafeteria roenbergensis]|uniref:Chalcone isomerase domain-containing protein n=1 Tax=Cafeteria roenbergensis TaxID=33653 RepID=A0A5A8DKL1_CAFRO|nr:hypothetical protein FNF29_03047 [Cafeteria roenbergensis]KAA0163472.1 hypothetical protein FNF31_02866 [Cafeteria roenbergensis]KAA0165936.1 hypothetical protein FNF28_03318 [Cafeteria roenbergensis]KAA0172695.1 hypothetical protein FNF27_05795 [Cafeteria roenbergensis]|eukprot:KAA0153659.1 hypothetical protein FNF29_03047 [Cafeteria roenbergensis]